MHFQNRLESHLAHAKVNFNNNLLWEKCDPVSIGNEANTISTIFELHANEKLKECVKSATSFPNIHDSCGVFAK